jgi:S-(hydroxymethyl)glutathione dehydrogenase / alcohol dehydrogenase
VLREVGAETLDIVDDLETVPVEAGFVRVGIRATGVCHSDLSAMNGTIPTPAPVVLGHEGAGEVLEVGDGVTNVHVGDHVIVVWVPPCGHCYFCLHGKPNLCPTVGGAHMYSPRFMIEGQPVFGFSGTGTFAEEVVLPQEGVIPVPPDIPWEIASLLGCAVTTGVGAALNAAKVTPGSSVVVYGCGGVGISIIQGAHVAGAADIVAVDLVELKRQDALRFGATHAAHPDELDKLKNELTESRGFDFAFEAIGLPQTIRAAYDAVRRGGVATVVGVGRLDQVVEFNAFELFYSEKSLIGTIYGSSDVRTEFHRLIKLWGAGRLDLEGMISQRVGLEDVNKAFDDMKAGTVIRSVVEIK